MGRRNNRTSSLLVPWMGLLAAVVLMLTATMCVGQATIEDESDSDSPEDGCNVLQGTTTYK